MTELVKKVVVSAYHLESNVIIECDYKLIVDVISKISADGSFYSVPNLLAILKATRSNVSRLTCFFSYYICCERKPVFSIVLKFPA